MCVLFKKRIFLFLFPDNFFIRFVYFFIRFLYIICHPVNQTLCNEIITYRKDIQHVQNSREPDKKYALIK